MTVKKVKTKVVKRRQVFVVGMHVAGYDCNWGFVSADAWPALTMGVEATSTQTVNVARDTTWMKWYMYIFGAPDTLQFVLNRHFVSDV